MHLFTQKKGVGNQGNTDISGREAYREAEKEKLEKQWTLLLQKAKKRELQARKSIFPVS